MLEDESRGKEDEIRKLNEQAIHKDKELKIMKQ